MTQLQALDRVVQGIEISGSPFLAKAVEAKRITGQAALWAMLDSYNLQWEERELAQGFLSMAKEWGI